MSMQVLTLLTTVMWLLVSGSQTLKGLGFRGFSDPKLALNLKPETLEAHIGALIITNTTLQVPCYNYGIIYHQTLF